MANSMIIPGVQMAHGVVADPRSWADTAGWSFWCVPGHADSITTAAAANLNGLNGFGWTTTALGVTEGSGADFISSADIDPTRIISDAAADLLVSPRIFGSYDHALMASKFLGYVPTKLTVEFYGRFATASANEATTFMGLAGPAVVDATAAGAAGAVTSGGTASTFFLKSDAGSDAGAAIDTAYHLWRIEFVAALTEWFLDNVSQGTITTELDIWPQSFVCFAGTTNRWELVWVNIRYS